jgi:hypothetical protein
MKLAGLFLAIGILAPAVEPDLSPPEKANIAKQIAAMKGAPDRPLAESFTNAGWKNFKFTCELNPETGKATAFTATAK